MDIRSSLTDAYLSRFFDPGALARAPACIVGVHALEIAQLTSGSLTATGRVWGTAPAPYDVQLHMEIDETSDWVFSSCSCPVGRLCKHGAALAMVVREGRALSEQPPVPSAWQQQLDSFKDYVALRTGRAEGKR